MVCAQLNRESGPGATAALAGWIVRESTSPLPARVVAWARHTTLDWLGVAIGGSDSPLVQILTDDVLADGGSGASRLVGRSERTSVAGAALINGAASHVLDFDDVNARMYGHPSVAVVPAVLALAEQRKSRGRNLIEALVVGCEVACRVGDWVGASHDEKGWHATATLGTFGATAGAARLLGLDAEKTAMALGIAATQASGLQSMFGTMCKPLHAGRAAMNGLLAARWAARGLTCNPQALECRHGFAHTQSTTFEPGSLFAREERYAIEANLFKYHAACYFTHASVAATLALRAEHRIVPDEVSRVRARIPRIQLESCNVAEPRNGLELKFSIRHVIAMALAGLDTGDPAAYTAETAMRPDLVELRSRVQVEPDDDETGYVADVRVELRDGRAVSRFVDAGRPETDLARQWQRLVQKFRRLAAPVIGDGSVDQVVAMVSRLEALEDVVPLLARCTRQDPGGRSPSRPSREEVFARVAELPPIELDPPSAEILRQERGRR